MRKVILVSMLVCCFGLPKAEGIVYFDDGGEWDIDYDVEYPIYIQDSSTGVPTTVNLLDGGCVPNVSVFDNSAFNMFGGTICPYGLETYDNSTAYICGGIIYRNLALHNDSQVTIAGTRFNCPYGTFHNPNSTLAGILLNGDPIVSLCYVLDSATMTLVPEPATLLLLGLGAVILRRIC